jgi:hypothetical protein
LFICGITVKRASLCFTVIPLGGAEQQNPLYRYAALLFNLKQQEKPKATPLISFQGISKL